MNEPRHILGSFETAMNSLDADLLEMAGRVERNLADAVQGLLAGDTDLCNRAIAGDEDVDRLEMKVDSGGHEIILRYSPLAADLRRVISSMKVGAALERVSDHAVSIARRGRELGKREAVAEREWIRPVYGMAARQLKQSVDAFSRGDLALAMEASRDDDALDRAYYELTDRLTARIQEDNKRAPEFIALLFVLRLLERVGDLAENIAEDAVYLLTAKDVRHGGEMPDSPAADRP